MKSIRLVALAVLGVAAGVAVACGNSSSSGPEDGGTTSSSGSTSGSTSSSGSSSGGSSGSSGSSSGSGDDSGGDDSGGGDDGGPILGNCPAACANPTTNCCLLNTDAGVLGACLTPTACAAMAGGFVMCGNTPDTVDCPDGSTTCCLSPSDAGGLPSSYCAASCPSGTSYACNTDELSCPNGGAGWACSPLPGTSVPVEALGQCTPVEGGAPEAGVDTGAPTDSGPQDAGIQ